MKGAFNGWWLDMAGRKIRRVRRGEYGELYRLLRICREIEKATPPTKDAA